MIITALNSPSSARSPRRASALALSLFVALTTLASVPAGAVTVASAPTAVVPAGPVDAFDRDSVIRGFTQTYLPTLRVPFSWTGSVDSCQPGTPSDQVRAATLTQINYMRDQAGASPVVLADEPNTQAQAAALIMDANYAISHQPPSTWKCWTATGAAGAAGSLLVVGHPRGLETFMSDPGEINKPTGHRVALLNDAIQVMGVGVTPRATGIHVQGLGNGDDDGRDRPMVTWPTSGYFPEGLLPDSTRWSATIRDARSLSDATVSVERVGGGLVSAPVEYRSRTHLVFTPSSVARPSQVGDDVTYRVRISNVSTDGNPVPDIVYTTTIVAADGIDATWSTRPSIQGQPTVDAATTVTAGSYTPVRAGDQVAYTWYSRGEVIGYGPSITPTMAQHGAPLSVEAKVRRAGGKTASATLVHSASDVTYSGPTHDVAAPVLSGDSNVGSTLDVSTGDWDRPPVAYEYRWFRGASMIEGALSATYTTTDADAGANITARVSAYSPDGQATHASSNSLAMPAPPTTALPSTTKTGSDIRAKGNPVIKGKGRVGKTLKVVLPTFSLRSVTIKIQWKRNGQIIKGAKGETYKVTKKDRKKKITVAVTARKSGLQATMLTSTPVKIRG